MHMGGAVPLGLPADRAIEVALLELLLASPDTERWRSDLGEPLHPAALVEGQPPPPEDAEDAADDDLDSIVRATCDRSRRTAQLVGLAPGLRATFDGGVTSVDLDEARLDWSVEVEGGSSLVRLLLVLGRPFVVAAADALALDLVRDLQRRAGALGGTRLRARTPAVLELAPLDPEPPIPPVAGLGQSVAIVVAMVAVLLVAVWFVLRLLLGAALGTVATLGVAVATVVAIYALGPRLLANALRRDADVAAP